MRGGSCIVWAFLQRWRAGIRAKLEPPAVSLGPFDVVPLVYEPPEAYLEMEIALLLANTEYQREALGRRVTMPVPGLEFSLAVLACEDMVLHKLLASRLIDRVDATELLRRNMALLDMQYLTGWVERLQLRREFAEVWGSVFPGQDVPGP